MTSSNINQVDDQQTSGQEQEALFNVTHPLYRGKLSIQSYFHNNAELQSVYKAACLALQTPIKGKASTVNGKILRSFDLLNRELFVNGNENLLATDTDGNCLQPVYREALDFIEANVPNAMAHTQGIRQTYLADGGLSDTNSEAYAQRLTALVDIIMQYLQTQPADKPLN